MPSKINPENVCSKIEIEEEDSTHKLEEMLKAQENLQYALGNSIKTLPWKERISKFKEMYIAMISEQTEAMDKIAWKPWRNYKEEDYELKGNALKEFKFELIDTFFFFMNQLLIFGIDAKEFYNIYMAKNKENLDRIKRGYSKGRAEEKKDTSPVPC